MKSEFYSLNSLILLCELVSVESKLVNKITGHLLQLIIGESLVKGNQAQTHMYVVQACRQSQ